MKHFTCSILWCQLNFKLPKANGQKLMHSFPHLDSFDRKCKRKLERKRKVREAKIINCTLELARKFCEQILHRVKKGNLDEKKSYKRGTNWTCRKARKGKNEQFLLEHFSRTGQQFNTWLMHSRGDHLFRLMVKCTKFFLWLS